MRTSCRRGWSPTNSDDTGLGVEGPVGVGSDTLSVCHCVLPTCVADRKKRVWWAAGLGVSLVLVLALGALMHGSSAPSSVGSEEAALAVGPSAQVADSTDGTITYTDPAAGTGEAGSGGNNGVTAEHGRQSGTLGDVERRFRQEGREEISSTMTISRREGDVRDLGASTSGNPGAGGTNTSDALIVLLSNSGEKFDKNLEEYYESLSPEVPDIFSDDVVKSREVFDDISIEVSGDFPSEDNSDFTIIAVRNISSPDDRFMTGGVNVSTAFFNRIQNGMTGTNQSEKRKFREIQKSDFQSDFMKNSTFGSRLILPKRRSRTQTGRLNYTTSFPDHSVSRAPLRVTITKQKLTSRNRTLLDHTAESGSRSTPSQEEIASSPVTLTLNVDPTPSNSREDLSPLSKVVFDALMDITPMMGITDADQVGSNAFSSNSKSMDTEKSITSRRRPSLHETIANLAPQIAAAIAPQLVGEEGRQLAMNSSAAPAAFGVRVPQVTSAWVSRQPQAAPSLSQSVLLVGDDTFGDYHHTGSRQQESGSAQPQGEDAFGMRLANSVSRSSSTNEDRQDHLSSSGGGVGQEDLPVLVRTPHDERRGATAFVTLNLRAEGTFGAAVEGGRHEALEPKVTINVFDSSSNDKTADRITPNTRPDDGHDESPSYKLTAHIPRGHLSIDIMPQERSDIGELLFEPEKLSELFKKDSAVKSVREGEIVSLHTQQIRDDSTFTKPKGDLSGENDSYSEYHYAQHIDENDEGYSVDPFPDLSKPHIHEYKRVPYHPVMSKYQPRSFTHSNRYIHQIVVQHPTPSKRPDSFVDEFKFKVKNEDQFDVLTQSKSTKTFEKDLRTTRPTEGFSSFWRSNPTISLHNFSEYSKEAQGDGEVFPQPQQAVAQHPRESKIMHDFHSSMESQQIQLSSKERLNYSTKNIPAHKRPSSQFISSRPKTTQSSLKTFHKESPDNFNRIRIHTRLLEKSNIPFLGNSTENSRLIQVEQNNHKISHSSKPRQLLRSGIGHSISDHRPNNPSEGLISGHISNFRHHQEALSNHARSRENLLEPFASTSQEHPIEVPSSVRSFLLSPEPSWIGQLEP